MKILKLHIYGFGQIEDLTISDLRNFQVFYGENEAGKSTISAFIHSVLFGFPAKQQAELRYEPKNQAKYGGKLTVEFEERGTAVIERVKGKAAGDVTVTLEDGTHGGELLLKNLLSQVDKSLFQAIFSFSLNGLQNIHGMKKEEIGRFLFSAGTLGTDRLSVAENELQKELDNRFKPGGKKPILNELLQEIHQINGDLKKAASKNQAYEQLIIRRDATESEMTELQKQIESLRIRENKLLEWIRIQPLIVEEQSIISKLKELGEKTFPVHGIQRLEKLLLMLNPLEAQLSSVQERGNAIQQEIAALKHNQELLDQESLIYSLLEKLPLLEKMKIEEVELQAKQNEVNEKLMLIKEKLHLNISHQEILNINTNIFVKQQVEEAYEAEQRLTEKKLQLDESFLDEKNDLEDLEAEIRNCQDRLLSDVERGNFIAEYGPESSRQKLKDEHILIQEKIRFYEKAEQQEKKRVRNEKKHKQRQFIAFVFFITVFMIYAFFTKQWLLGSIAVFINVFIIGMYAAQKSSKVIPFNSKEMEDLLKQEAEIRNKLSKMQSGIQTHAQKQLEKDDQLREYLKQLRIKLEQKNIQYEKVLKKFEIWEEEDRVHERNVAELKYELGLPKNLKSAHILEAFRLIEQLKSLLRDGSRLEDRLHKIHSQSGEIEDAFLQISTQFLSESEHDFQRNAFLLRKKLKEENEKQIQAEELNKKLLETEAATQEYFRQHKNLKDEITKLLTEAETENETEFVSLGKQAEQRLRLQDKLFEIKSQKSYSFLTDNDVDDFKSYLDCDDLVKATGEQIKTLQDKMKTKQETIAQIKYELQMIEEGGIYSELLHTFKQKQYELQEAAKEWGAYNLAQTMLSRNVEKYKNQRLPEMLAKAEEYLMYLTDGKYRRIFQKETGTGFFIESDANIMFEANELSQATMEQVYVSLRLALAVTLYEKYSFPIMIDDSFVNFDERRTSKMIHLLKGLKNNQILFFTCHKHMLHYFAQSDILQLEKGKVTIHS